MVLWCHLAGYRTLSTWMQNWHVALIDAGRTRSMLPWVRGKRNDRSTLVTLDIAAALRSPASEWADR